MNEAYDSQFFDKCAADLNVYLMEKVLSGVQDQTKRIQYLYIYI